MKLILVPLILTVAAIIDATMSRDDEIRSFCFGLIVGAWTTWIAAMFIKYGFGG